MGFVLVGFDHVEARYRPSLSGACSPRFVILFKSGKSGCLEIRTAFSKTLAGMRHAFWIFFYHIVFNSTTSMALVCCWLAVSWKCRFKARRVFNASQLPRSITPSRFLTPHTTWDTLTTQMQRGTIDSLELLSYIVIVLVPYGCKKFKANWNSSS